MKTLYLVRHAKSSWKHAGLSDEERPLNGRGKHDAPFMGELLFKKGVKPESIISSFAKRAVITSRIIAEKINFPDDKIVIRNDLYLADLNELLGIIAGFNDKNNSIMIVGHNPGFTFLFNHLTGLDIDNLPTCGTACIKLNIDSWANVEKESGELEFYEYPKKYKE